jgi:hypothetical protein
VSRRLNEVFDSETTVRGLLLAFSMTVRQFDRFKCHVLAKGVGVLENIGLNTSNTSIGTGNRRGLNHGFDELAEVIGLNCDDLRQKIWIEWVPVQGCLGSLKSQCMQR